MKKIKPIEIKRFDPMNVLGFSSCDFETAKLLNALEIDIPFVCCYQIKDGQKIKMKDLNFSLTNDLIGAPPIALISKWLRTQNEIFVNVVPCKGKKGVFVATALINDLTTYVLDDAGKVKEFDNYEEAEKAIIKNGCEFLMKLKENNIKITNDFILATSADKEQIEFVLKMYGIKPENKEHDIFACMFDSIKNNCLNWEKIYQFHLNINTDSFVNDFDQNMKFLNNLANKGESIKMIAKKYNKHFAIKK